MESFLTDIVREAEAGAEGEGHLEHSTEVCGGSGSSCLLQDGADCEVELCSSQFTVIIFPFLALTIGVLSMPISRMVKVPYTLFLLIVGILLGLLGCGVDLGLLSTSLRQWVHIYPPTIFFYVFLAPLIFEASFNTQWHVFKRLLVPILTAAFVIVGLQIGLIATFQKKVIRTDDWTWWSALMFGAMLSATDPISVTATLKSLGASEFLNTLIEGESLVNDGSAFVLFEAFFENTVEPGALSIGEIVGKVLRLSIGGMLMGVAFGIGALIILGLVYDEFEVETSLTVIVSFLGFWTAQAPSKLSGVICNVASGLVISAFGRHLITPAVRGPLAEFWHLLSWIANTVVFVHAGVLLSVFTWSCAGSPNGYKDYLYIPAYFLFLQVIRVGLIFIFRPFMAIRNRWFQWKEAAVVGFSGLRGAVSLVLALEVAGSPAIPENVKSRVVLWVTGIVGLSLLVNGFLVKPLIQFLKLDKATKSREDFLHRGRAIMVQRSLTILDSLCIETGFKAARWSYVVKNALPSSWLEEDDHAQEYREALEQLMANGSLSARKSLEVVRNEERRKIVHSQVSHRLSMDIPSLQATPSMTPRVSVQKDGRRDSLAMPYSPRRTSQAVRNPVRLQVNDPGLLGEFNQEQHAVPRSVGLGPSNSATYSRTSGNRMSIDFDADRYRLGGGGNRLSIDADVERYRRGGGGGGNRLSIDADVQRYRPGAGVTRMSIEPGAQRYRVGAHVRTESQGQIHRDVAEQLRMAVGGQYPDFTDEDREVQRRLLTAILSHVRALSNASLVEFSVTHNLEEDCQRALDANDEGHDYDLFSFLDNHGRQSKSVFYKRYQRLIEGKRLRGQTAITNAVIIFGIMTEILKEEMLLSSDVVQLQAEHLYEGSAALLNRLETLNPLALEWVETQFAVYVSARKQDEVLRDMLETGIVDSHEYKVIHDELIDVRRRHVQSRHSIFHLGRQKRLPDPPKPTEILKDHPLFADLSPALKSGIVDKYGQMIHLKGGQSLQSEKGSLVLVVSGAIRPMEDNVLPTKYADRIKQTTTDYEVAIADMHSPAGTPAPAQAHDQSNSSGSTPEEDQSRVPGFTPLASGASMHWCFPAHNAFCGPAVTLHSHNHYMGSSCPIAKERVVDTQFCACEIAGSATVFTLPVVQVRQLAKESPEFRIEITRSLAREIVLESVADQRPYQLSHFMHSTESDENVHTVVGRAFRVLERLPYMTVIALKAGEMSTAHVQGPGVLLNGTVRVSIVDSSGLVGAINLLHEELTGPALLPAGGLIIQEVHKVEDPRQLRQEFGDMEPVEGLESVKAADAADAACELLDLENGSPRSGERTIEGVLAHILIEDVSEDDQTTTQRLGRWTSPDGKVDMNGRFGMYRHVELAPLTNMKVE